MHAMKLAMGRADRTAPARNPAGLTIRPRGSAVRRPLRTMGAAPASSARPIASVDTKPALAGWVRWLGFALALAFAVLACRAAVGIAALPSPARTQSLVGAPEVTGYVADARSPETWVSDINAPAYRIDPGTYATTLMPPALKDLWTNDHREIRWATRWPAFWTASSSFIALNLAFGFVTMGALVFASSLGAAGERARR